MGTRGYMAYRYKGKLLCNGKYHRVYLTNSAYPSGYGEGYASDVPRDPVALEDWVEKTIKRLEEKEQRAKIHGWEGQEVYTSPDWTLGSLFIEWTYVFDLDNRVFTVNGAVHFPFDNMPPLYASNFESGFSGYLESHDKIEIPAKYLKTIDLWPVPRFDVTRAQLEYEELRPLVIALPEWSPPTWESLSVSQRLSAYMIKTLIHDYSDELALAHYSSVWHKIGLFCWQVANAASPSHLICPPLDATPQNNVLYVRTDLVKQPQPKGFVRTIHNHLGGKGTLGQYCWFRDCLVTFCPRLDEPSRMAYQVTEISQRLRNHERTNNVGIIMSGWHVVAVTIDGPTVRHSPALALHNGQEPRDGVLLLMHLLGPVFTSQKIPWRSKTPIHQPVNGSSTLPDDVLNQIIHYTDLETYLSLQLVSRYVRLICLAYPRVGNHILMSYESSSNLEPMFRVRSTSSAYSTFATLWRTKCSVEEPGPIWRFRSKHYSKCVLNPGLAGTFQYYQSGVGPLDSTVGADLNSKPPSYRPQRLLFRDMIKKDVCPDMRIQTVDGIWEMVLGGPGNSQTQETHGNSPEGPNIYETMTGFESSDLDELSEVEPRGLCK